MAEDMKIVGPALGLKLSVPGGGFIRLVDVMGTDASVVQAARISYGEGTKQVNEDRGLIRYLMRHGHTTPFEMAAIKIHVRCPMDVWRQWIRHRTASVNEYSTRYSLAIDEAATTAPGEWRKQSTTNKQGSGGYVEDWPARSAAQIQPGEQVSMAEGLSVGEHLSKCEAQLHDHARRVYEQRLSLGVAREQARKDLPLSTYTEAYWMANLHNVLHFLSLRMDPHAQEEIRAYAVVLGEQIVAPLFPLTWEAFRDYRLGGVRLSRLEVAAISRAAAAGSGMLGSIAAGSGLVGRELAEFRRKLEALGFHEEERTA